jgi:hypothetical protein
MSGTEASHNKRRRCGASCACCAAGQSLERLLRELFKAKLLGLRDELPSLFMKAYCTSFAMCVSSREYEVCEILVRVLQEEVRWRCGLNRAALRLWKAEEEEEDEEGQRLVEEIFCCLKEKVGEDAARIILYFGCIDEETVHSAVSIVCNSCFYVKRFYLANNAPWGNDLLSFVSDLSEFCRAKGASMRSPCCK